MPSSMGKLRSLSEQEVDREATRASVLHRFDLQLREVGRFWERSFEEHCLYCAVVVLFVFAGGHVSVQHELYLSMRAHEIGTETSV